MKKEEVLIEILKQLKIGDNTFRNQILKGEAMEAGILLAVNAVVFIVLLVVFRKFNEEFSIFSNLSKAYHELRKPNTAPANQKKEPEDPFDKMVLYIKNFLYSHSIWCSILSLIAAVTELCWLIAVIKNLVEHGIVAINCMYAPEKVIMDYLSSLF